MNAFDHNAIDDLIHSRIRLPIVALLANATAVDFTYLRDAVNTTDGNLGMHLRKLEDAGYVEVEKTFMGRKPVTRYTLSTRGRAALDSYAERIALLLGRMPPVTG